jgi:putative chitinase
MQLTEQILLAIAPGANRQLIADLVGPLNQYLPQYGINTLIRLDHFLGQAAEESDSFRTLTEYASGREYEGRRDLGNVQPGDGERYKGRGIFQLTGRSNYESIGTKLGLNLVNNPELAATPDVAVRTACEYWNSRGLSALADNDDVRGVTRRINGGTNGLQQRSAFTDAADTALTPFFPGQ